MFRVCLLLREIYHLILDSVLLLFTYKFNLNGKSLKAACSFKKGFSAAFLVKYSESAAKALNCILPCQLFISNGL